MDKLKAFESFVSVATRGSLTAAAKAEGVAPAIMGRRLDALEAHLGVKLLVRTTRRISLTPRCSSRASSRRPMMAGATPSALAAAVRLPRVATDTKDSKALSLSMGADYGDKPAQGSGAESRSRI